MPRNDMVILATITLFLTACSMSGWTPPRDPNPPAILEEAVGDTNASRYEVALAKHVWYHEHALEYEPAQYGVRLSFALSYWMELARRYPAALSKLVSIRDQAEDRVRRGDVSRRGAFDDLVSINRAMGENAKTVSLFKWLEETRPQDARDAFFWARDALIEAGEYLLCGRYIGPYDVRALIDELRLHREMSREPQFDDELRVYGEKAFIRDVGTLVALLVVNERPAAADKVIAEALAAWDDPFLKEELERARKGQVPPRGLP